MNHTIIHFEIPANDMQKIKDFYSSLFGWKIESFMGGDDYMSVTTAPEGKGVDGGIMKKKMPQQTGINYVEVESVDEYAAKVKKLGGQIVMDKMAVPKMGWFVVAVDPEGNPIGLWETDANAA